MLLWDSEERTPEGASAEKAFGDPTHGEEMVLGQQDSTRPPITIRAPPISMGGLIGSRKMQTATTCNTTKNTAVEHVGQPSRSPDVTSQHSLE